MGKLMDRVFLLIPMDPCMKVNGLMISNMDLVLNLGSIIRSSSLVILSMGRRLEKEGLNLKVGSMKVILLMANSTDSANITLQIQANFTKEDSETTTWKAKDSWFGLINPDTKVNLSMGRWREKVPKFSPQETSTSVSGGMICNMELVSFSVSKIRLKDKVSGPMAREALGSTVPNKHMLLVKEINWVRPH